MKIGKRIGLMFGVLLTAMTALSLLSMQQSHHLSQSLAMTSNEILPKVEQAGQLTQAFLALRTSTLRHVLAKTPEQMQQIDTLLSRQRADIDQGLQHYQQRLSPANQTETGLIDRIRDALAEYYRHADAALELSRSNQNEQALSLIESQIAPAAQKTQTSLQQLVSLNQQQAQQEQQQAHQQYQNGLWLQSLALAALLIIAIGTGLWFHRSLTRPLQQLRDLVTSIETEHDFTRRLTIQQDDEIGETLKAFNSLVSSVQTSLQEITVSSHGVSEAAEGLQRSAGALAQSSQNQSDAAAQMAATMEQMTVSISHMSDRGQDTHSMASQAGQIAHQSAAVIESTVKDINQIDQVMQTTAQQIASLEKQSESISAVVNVIKEVADQTNLLALNAAIEAARAGEQGRGFAVVAEEVRKLAERTASSTQEITRMVQAVQQDAQNAVRGVENAVTQVNQGVTHAREAGSAIEQIRSSTVKVADMVSEMAHAISEQSSASNSIAGNVERIATMSEENHLTSDNTARAAASLNETAERMAEIVGRFKL